MDSIRTAVYLGVCVLLLSTVCQAHTSLDRRLSASEEQLFTRDMVKNKQTNKQVNFGFSTISYFSRLSTLDTRFAAILQRHVIKTLFIRCSLCVCFLCFVQAEALESFLEGDGDRHIALDKRASIIPRVKLLLITNTP